MKKLHSIPLEKESNTTVHHLPYHEKNSKLSTHFPSIEKKHPLNSFFLFSIRKFIIFNIIITSTIITSFKFLPNFFKSFISVPWYNVQCSRNNL